MKIAVVGSALTGGGVQIVDILLEENLASDIRIYDDDENAQSSEVLGVPVVGTIDRLLSDQHDGLVDSAVIAVGTINARERLYKKFSTTTLLFPNIFSSRATISRSAVLGKGNILLPHVYIGPRVCVGNNNYITTSTVINHDSNVGSHCYFSAGVCVAGRVSIEDRVRLDTGCSITADAVIISDSLIGPCESFGPVRGH